MISDQAAIEVIADGHHYTKGFFPPTPSFLPSLNISLLFFVYLLTPYSDYVHAAAAAVNAGVNLEDANEQNNSFALLGQALQMGLIKEDVINQVSEGDREEMGSKGRGGGRVGREVKRGF